MKKANMSFALCAALFTVSLASLSYAEEIDPEFGPNITIEGKGRLALVDAGFGDDTPLKAVANKVGGFMMIGIGIEKGSWTFAGAADALKATKATAAVFVVKDKSLPITLVAQESRWGVVNADGMNAKQVEKAVLRVAALLLGAASSKYPVSVMRPVFTLEDLDKAGEVLTVDTLMAIMPNLAANGFTCRRTLTYREACEQGIAPAPKTDLEKKIAADVKAGK